MSSNVGEYNTYNFCIWHLGLCVIVSKIERCRSSDPPYEIAINPWWRGGRGLPSLIALLVMLFQYLSCVFNMQSQHGIWEMLQHFFTKHRENGLKLTDFCILPSSSSEACIAEYVRIPSYCDIWCIHTVPALIVVSVRHSGLL